MEQNNNNSEQNVDVSIEAFDNAQVFTPKKSTTKPDNASTPPANVEEDENKNKDKTPDNQGKEGTSSTPDSSSDDKGKDKDKPKPNYDTEDNRTKFKSYLNDLNNEELSNSQKAVKEALLEGITEGTINKEGDVIDKEGNIVKKFDDIFKDFVTEEDVTLDDKGNQIDKEGNIIKTKAELAAASDDDVLNKAHQELGYEFQTDDEETKVYPNNTQGALEFAKDYAKKYNFSYMQSLYNKYPQLPDLLNHLELGGDIKDFNAAIDYSKVDKASLSVEDKLATIKKSLEVKGLGKERIDNHLQLVKDGNTVDKEYDFAVSDITAYDKEISEQRKQQVLAQETAEQERIVKHWNTVKENIKDNKVSYINIPDAEKDKFFNYLSSPIDDKGNSQEMLDLMKESMADQLGLAYLRYKGFDFGKLLKQKERESRVSNLKKLVAQDLKFDAESSKEASNDNSGKEQPDIDIATVLG